MTEVGTDGTFGTSTALDGVEGPLVPTELVAVTVKVYVTPAVRPVTAQVVAAGLPVDMQDPPLSPVTVYVVSLVPVELPNPSFAGAVHETDMDVESGMYEATGTRGAVGAVGRGGTVVVVEVVVVTTGTVVVGGGGNVVVGAVDVVVAGGSVGVVVTTVGVAVVVVVGGGGSVVVVTMGGVVEVGIVDVVAAGLLICVPRKTPTVLEERNFVSPGYVTTNVCVALEK